MSLNFGSAGNWNVQTTVDLRKRSDTNRPNISPITASKPIYKVQWGCAHALKIPMIDPDGDDVRCRWSTSAEAASISRLLPHATIDEQTCTIHFTATNNYVPGGWYAVAITVEDYPRKDITLDGTRYTPHSKLSSVPLQFLINTPALSGSCSEHPVFVNNTPTEGAVIPIRAHQTLRLRFYASSRYSISNIVMTSPAGLTSSSLKTDDMGRPHVRYTDITWTPSQSQKGSHILCGLADDRQGKTSDPRCITLLAWDRDPCESTLCENNGTCIRIGFTDNWFCSCVPGYTGVKCEIDIDECLSRPCQNSGTCLDLINSYHCVCRDGFTGINCETDINECASSPCLQNATCIDQINSFTCVCPQGWSGVHCQTGMYHCASLPCLHNGICHNTWGGFRCDCPAPWNGSICEYRDFDSSQECAAMEYTKCDCVMNTKKKRIPLKQYIRSASYGMALGIVCSLGAYIFWVCSQPGTSFKWSYLSRVFPMTGQKQPTSDENENMNLEHRLTNQGFSKRALGPSKTKFSGVF